MRGPKHRSDLRVPGWQVERGRCSLDLQGFMRVFVVAAPPPSCWGRLISDMNYGITAEEP